MEKNIFHGDYKRLIWAYNFGKVAYIPLLLSTYNYGNINGLTYLNSSVSYKKMIKKVLDRKKCLEEYNVVTKNKFSKIINKRYREIEFNVLKLKVLDAIQNSKNKKEIKMLYKNLIGNVYFKEISFVDKMKIVLKYNFFYKYYIKKG